MQLWYCIFALLVIILSKVWIFSFLSQHYPFRAVFHCVLTSSAGLLVGRGDSLIFKIKIKILIKYFFFKIFLQSAFFFFYLLLLIWFLNIEIHPHFLPPFYILKCPISYLLAGKQLELTDFNPFVCIQEQAASAILHLIKKLPSDGLRMHTDLDTILSKLQKEPQV